MKYLIAMFLVVASACSFTVVDTRSPEVVSATQTARAYVEPTMEALATEEAPQQDCQIKMNIGSDGQKIFHIPSGAYYSRVRIDLDRGEGYACTEGQAVAEGFRRSER